MAHGIMRGQFMFNKRNYLLLFLAVLAGATYSENVLSAQDNVASVSASALPINVASKTEEATSNVDEAKKLVSPSQAKNVAPTNSVDTAKENKTASQSSNFDFDLKMKSISKTTEKVSSESVKKHLKKRKRP